MANKGNYSINGVAVEALGVVSPDALTDPTKWPVEEIEGYNYRHVMFADPQTGAPQYPAFFDSTGQALVRPDGTLGMVYDGSSTWALRGTGSRVGAQKFITDVVGGRERILRGMAADGLR
jgi:hypothetical protein